MKKLLSFFEIPSADFQRACDFYARVFGIELEICACREEKMAFFPADENGPSGALIYSADYRPGPEGVLISFGADPDLDVVLSRVSPAGGRVLVPKTRIDAEDLGWFAVFADSEGNRIGLHSRA